MAYVPKEEYVPRRGVAMKVVVPNPKVRTGVMRDAVVEAEAAKFQEKEFILNRAMQDQEPKASKVKTFRKTDIPWAHGNGNVIAPPKPEAKQYRRIIGQRVADEDMPKFYHGGALERERQAEQDRMQYCRNFADNFSHQRPDRMHKIMPRTLELNSNDASTLDTIFGFRGLGTVVRDKPIGKGHVPETSYDPLNMRNWAPRMTGLKRLPASNATSFPEGSLQYNDNVPFETTQKRSFPHPHVHRFPEHHGPESDMQGFRGLGVSDVTPAPRGRKHTPRWHQDRHFNPPPSIIHPNKHSSDNAIFPAPQGHALSPYAGGGGAAALSPTSVQFRSATSMGIASPSHDYRSNGRVSAPLLASNISYHPVQN
jgi:hypothetical protein